MKAKTLAGILALALLLTTGAAAAQDRGATLFRVFLKDGGTLVSYGEVARVGDQIVSRCRPDREVRRRFISRRSPPIASTGRVPIAMPSRRAPAATSKRRRRATTRSCRI